MEALGKELRDDAVWDKDAANDGEGFPLEAVLPHDVRILVLMGDSSATLRPNPIKGRRNQVGRQPKRTAFHRILNSRQAVSFESDSCNLETNCVEHMFRFSTEPRPESP